MLQQDKTIAETGEARNQLESYSLEMRSRIQGGDLSSYCDEKDKQPFVDQLQQAEDWIYSDEGSDAQKSEYKTRLQTLKKIGDPIMHREQEHKNRDHFVNILNQTIQQSIASAQTKDEKYSHIEQVERQKIISQAHEIESWLKQTLSQQQVLSLFKPCVLTEHLMNSKKHELDQLTNVTMGKPKPKPVVAPKPQTPQPEQQQPQKPPTPAPNAQNEQTSEQQSSQEQKQPQPDAAMDTQ